MIRGAIYTVALLVVLFLLFVVTEHFGYLPSVVRAVLFWLYIVVSLFVIGYYVVFPLMQMHKLGPRLSYEQAAKIIGDFFPDVSDKLLNFLQLRSMDNDGNSDLLEATIRQKTAQLSPIPFRSAVDLKTNKKYVKYAAIPLAVLLLLLVLSPTTVTESSNRIVHYSTFYERPAPFAFVVDNDTLEASTLSDFTLRVSVCGDAVPDEAYLCCGGASYKMHAVDASHFSYTLKKLRGNVAFYFEGGGVRSADYELVVHPKPQVVDFSAALSYPAYTGRSNEVVSNEGDLTVPRGTIIKWVFQTKDVDTLFFSFGEKVQRLIPDENGRLSLALRAMETVPYCFYVSNSHTPVLDTLSYAVSVIQDAPPLISVSEALDSTIPDRRLFCIRIKDDYGFSHLDFKWVKTNVQDTTTKVVEVRPLALSNENQQDLYYAFNLNEVVLSPGDKLQYFFEVCDNNAVDGPQCVCSQQFQIEIPTEQELEKILDKNSTNVERQAESSMSELKKLQEDINELMRKLVDKKELSWQDKQQLQELSERQKEVRSTLEKMQQQLKENSLLEQKYREQSEQIMEKQRELERLFNEVMDDKMKEMMQEIDRLLEETDKKKVQEELQSLKLDNDELEKQIDQNIELMKRLEMERKVEETVKKVDDLAEKQRELSKQAEKGDNKQQLLEKQQELSKEFQDIKKDIKKIEDGYKEMDAGSEFKSDKDLQHKIDQQQQTAEQQLQKGKNKNASKQQKEAADDLNKLSEQLAEAQMEMEQQDLAEDAEMVRRLLKNLVRLSFRQEELITAVNSTLIQDPKYQSIIGRQNLIKEDFRSVEDSLRAMAKRQVNVASAISKELSEVNANIAKSLSDLLEFNQSFYGNSKNQKGAKPMQYTMTSLNNLSLVLAESLDKMQNQMRQNQQQKKQGSCKRQGMKKQGSCSNPGKGKPSPKSMKQMQDELNKQMEALKKQLDKQGKQDGKGRKKLGEKSGMSEQFAKMAAQQEMIRRMMQEYGQEMKQQNAGNSKLAKEIDDMMRQMEQTETDLVNKTITQQTLRRQQQIMTRMLEHEKAEMQREKEERRESHEASQQLQQSPSDLEQFKRLQKSNDEIFHTTPASMTPFYKNKVSDYFYHQ